MIDHIDKAETVEQVDNIYVYRHIEVRTGKEGPTEQASEFR